jgi:hypothetical protein
VITFASEADRQRCLEVLGLTPKDRTGTLGQTWSCWWPPRTGPVEPLRLMQVEG